MKHKKMLLRSISVLLIACTILFASCHEEDGAHTHTKDVKGTTVAPTCTAQGYTYYTCQCGETFLDDYVNPTAHRMAGWYLVNEPFCYNDGLERRVCFDCSYAETRKVPSEETEHVSGELIVEDFPAIPYKVYKSYTGRYFTEDILATRTESFTDYYIDTKNGSDSNAGTSANAPVKTLKRALQLAQDKAFRITILNEGAVMFADSLYGSSAYMLNQSGIIRARSKATLVGGIENPGFSKLAGYKNVYSTASLPKGKMQSGLGVSAVVDMDSRNVGTMGLYTALTPVKSVEEVEAVDGSYYYDNSKNIMYVNPVYGIETVHPLLASYQLYFNLQNAKQNTMLYMENLNVIGGFHLNGHSSTSGSGDVKLEFVAKNSTFQHNFLNNNLTVHNFNGSYMIDCVAGYSLQDGYNYHAVNLDYENRISAMHVEVNCRAAECGFYRLKFKVGDVNNNLTTGHEGINVLRVNFSGKSSYGPLIADVNGCHSVCIDCTVYTDYEYVGSHDDFHFNEGNQTRRGKAILINCYAYDNRQSAVRLQASVEYLTVEGGNLLQGKVNNSCEHFEELTPCEHSYQRCSKFETVSKQIYQLYHCIHCGDTYFDERFLAP